MRALCDGPLVAAPERREIREALLAILGRHAGARESLDGALEGADAKHVDTDTELVECVLEVSAVAVVAIDEHEAHRIEIDLIGLGGEVVTLLRELGAVGNHLLAAGAELAQGGGELLQGGLGRAAELLQIERQHPDARVTRRRVDRVGQVPQQGLRVPLAARLLDRALDGLAAELLDQLSLGCHEQRRLCGDPRHAAAQQPEEEREDHQQHYQVQGLAQAVQAAPQSGKERAGCHDPGISCRELAALRGLPAHQIFSSIRAALPERSRR